MKRRQSSSCHGRATHCTATGSPSAPDTACTKEKSRQLSQQRSSVSTCWPTVVWLLWRLLRLLDSCIFVKLIINCVHNHVGFCHTNIPLPCNVTCDKCHPSLARCWIYPHRPHNKGKGGNSKVWLRSLSANCRPARISPLWTVGQSDRGNCRCSSWASPRPRRSLWTRGRIPRGSWGGCKSWSARRHLAGWQKERRGVSRSAQKREAL